MNTEKIVSDLVKQKIIQNEKIVEEQLIKVITEVIESEDIMVKRFLPSGDAEVSYRPFRIVKTMEEKILNKDLQIQMLKQDLLIAKSILEKYANNGDSDAHALLNRIALGRHFKVNS